jgi:hypothetical protein
VEQRNPTSARGGNRDVTLYSPYTHQWVTFPADSPLVASLPGYWIRVGALPEGPTNLRAPESESEAAADGNAPPQAAPMPANRARAYTITGLSLSRLTIAFFDKSGAPVAANGVTVIVEGY